MKVSPLSRSSEIISKGRLAWTTRLTKNFPFHVTARGIYLWTETRRHPNLEQADATVDGRVV